MQARVGELHLGLNPDRPRDPKSIGSLGEVVQQGGLPDPGLAAHKHHTAMVIARVHEQLVERFGLAAPTS